MRLNKWTGRIGLSVTVALLTLTVSGCIQFRRADAEVITRAELLEKAGTDAKNQMAYMGSDDAHHYIFHSRIPGGGSYKIEKEQLPLKETFSIRLGKRYVLMPWMIEGADPDALRP